MQTGEDYTPTVTITNISNATGTNHAFEGSSITKFGNKYFGVIRFRLNRPDSDNNPVIDVIFLPTSITPEIVQAARGDGVATPVTILPSGTAQVAQRAGGFRMHPFATSASSELIYFNVVFQYF